MELSTDPSAIQPQGEPDVFVAEDVELTDLDVRRWQAAELLQATSGGIRGYVITARLGAQQGAPPSRVVVVRPRGIGRQLGIRLDVAVIQHRVDQDLLRDCWAAVVPSKDG